MGTSIEAKHFPMDGNVDRASWHSFVFANRVQLNGIKHDIEFASPSVFRLFIRELRYRQQRFYFT